MRNQDLTKLSSTVSNYVGSREMSVRHGSHRPISGPSLPPWLSGMAPAALPVAEKVSDATFAHGSLRKPHTFPQTE